MSNDDAPVEPVPHDESNAPDARARREALREKAQKVRTRQSRVRWIRRGAIGVGIVAVVGVVGTVVFGAVNSAMSEPQLTPANSTHDQGFAISAVTGIAGVPPAPTDTPPAEAPAADATPTAAPPVEIQVYVDYLSTGARDWQVANAKQLASWVNDGAATLTYHPVSMMTAKSNGTKYSLRAAAAAACVASYSPDQFFPYNQELLARQPTVDSDGYSDSDLADIAQAAGVSDPDHVRSCILDGAYQDWVRDATEAAVAGIPGADGLALTGTPMVLVNGEKYAGSLSDPAEFSQFVLTSASGAFYKSQTPTPTATPTATP